MKPTDLPAWLNRDTYLNLIVPALLFGLQSPADPGGHNKECSLMKVYIKKLQVDMDIKNNGIELDVSDNNGSHMGDLYVTKTQLIWCTGRTRKPNGKTISWDDFAAYMAQRP